MSTATKPTPATLKIELRGGQRVYKLAARERGKLVAAVNLACDLGAVAELKELSNKAQKALEDLLAMFPVE